MNKTGFPNSFIWGASTASYQIEGAVKQDGRGESVWDEFTSNKGNILNNETAAVTCDHYNQYVSDVSMMKEIGLSGYRFSISWSRIMPGGKGSINQQGVDFYSSLIDQLLENNIEPFITLNHWDYPQMIQNDGGWNNRNNVGLFVDYADKMFKLYGDRVKSWMTHNEPWVIMDYGHVKGIHAPGIKDMAIAVQTSHHLILSHALAVEAFKAGNIENGKIGIALNLHPSIPHQKEVKDIEAARINDGYVNRWFLDPVLKGEYPEDMLKLYDRQLKRPLIAENDMKTIKNNPVDFLGINYYFPFFITADEESFPGFKEVPQSGPDLTTLGWNPYPEGLLEILQRIHDEYEVPEIYITENGYPETDEAMSDGVIDDSKRIEFLNNHLRVCAEAVEKGINLKGYFVWSLMDNFEWACGFSQKFGLIHTDFDTLDRTFKKSAGWYSEVIKSNGSICMQEYNE